MINDLKNVSLLNIVYCLIDLIMVYKNYLLLVHVQEITSGYGTDTFALLVDDRECTMTVLDHDILDIICKIFGIKSYKIFCFHDISDRNTLVDQSRDRKGIIRGRNNDDILLMCEFHNIL